MKESAKKSFQKILNIPFLRKNFRNMYFEEQVIFVSQLATLIGCFLPWVSLKPTVYGQPYYHTAFSGFTSVIGFFVFFIAAFASIFFLEKIWQKKWIHLPIENKTILHFSNIQSIILLISAWSVFTQIETGATIVSTSFGWFLCLFAQITTLVAHFLATQNEKTQATKDFFINKSND